MALAGLVLLFFGQSLPLSIVYRTPTYTSDTIILYDGTFPQLTYNSEIERYQTRLYYQINFNPPSADTKYYYLVEASNVNVKVLWSLWFYNTTTGGLGSGVGAWIMEPNQKFSGVEMAGYTVIPWTWYRSGVDYMVLDLKADAQPSGNLKVMIKWTVPPKPTYTAKITSVKCDGLNQQILVQGYISPAVGAKQITINVTYPSGKQEKRFILTATDGSFNYTDLGLVASEVGTYTVQVKVDSSYSEPYTFTIGEQKQQQLPPPPPVYFGLTLSQLVGGALFAIGIGLIVFSRR
jgi:hypothetical protein